MTPLQALLALVATTFIPGLELRASIPLGFFTPAIREAMTLTGVVLTCLATNVVLGVIVFAVMRHVEAILRKWGWFDRRVWPLFESKREKLRPLVEKYGAWGVAVFIGVPLPGTGAYAGAVGAYLLGLDRKRFWLANALGVAMACIAVTALCALILGGADLGVFQRLFLKVGEAG
ncbi:MAG: small multi-drug export protein [Kiritimatiellae bacterium]|nr:small multi-drug export protein [Kiritimatiellia bacterium]